LEREDPTRLGGSRERDDSDQPERGGREASTRRVKIETRKDAHEGIQDPETQPRVSEGGGGVHLGCVEKMGSRGGKRARKGGETEEVPLPQKRESRLSNCGFGPWVEKREQWKKEKGKNARTTRRKSSGTACEWEKKMGGRPMPA